MTILKHEPQQIVILSHPEILSWRSTFANQNLLLLRISECERRNARSVFEYICERERTSRTAVSISKGV
jgi:hypothetical protein